jgi:hypothetical protein
MKFLQFIVKFFFGISLTMKLFGWEILRKISLISTQKQLNLQKFDSDSKQNDQIFCNTCWGVFLN